MWYAHKFAVELDVEVADRLVLVLVSRSAADGVDLRRRVRPVAQVDGGEAKLGCTSHGLIEPLEQDDERVVERSLPSCPTASREDQG